MKILGPVSILLALILQTSAPKAGMIDIDIDPTNAAVGSPSVGDDTNPSEEVRWLEALFGYSYNDSAIVFIDKFIDKQDTSGLGGRALRELYDPSSVFIDKFFGNQILPGYPDYREENQEGYTTIDLRVSYDIWRETSLSIICKNLMNVEYMGRPGDIRPHRNITVQFLMKF